ncbi:uncharacterized protein LOC144097845 [Amblyomma americanum]
MDRSRTPEKHHNPRHHISLRTLFSTLGLPRTLVSDNGPQFTSADFREFMKLNNITHLRTAPYHPQSNGLAERTVRTVKVFLKKNVHGSLKTRLARILHKYGRTPQSGGSTPAQLLMGYERRSRLDNAVAPTGPLASQSPVDRHVLGVLRPREPVWVKSFGRADPWIPARITSSDGTRMVNADGPEGENIRRHTDQIKPRVGEHDLDDGSDDTERQDGTASPQVVGTPGQGPGIREAAPSTPTLALRRSSRTRKPPDSYVPQGE